ncbi:UNVERIFIED_CONTAM: Retrovirus-related Pol polyprotein from transposon TNT 1-94 [Sesamum calycinum]|uniref:Retrovirus-related Pol polyprotein from transposon TNT 1-94 n=1 Tax=Sesamum calycinum TaxID=2727403 RepID=A0AAW2KWA7_9LAMI
MKGLELLHKHGILTGRFDEMDFCDDCTLGKQHKVHFPSPTPNPTASACVLDYVHVDVWGPANVPTHGGNIFFLSIIDNFSRKVFVFLMKSKHGKTLLKTKRNNDELEHCAQKCIFIGYLEGVKEYRLWLRNHLGFKVVINKDVTFNESEMPCLNNSPRKEIDFHIEKIRNETQNDISENTSSINNYQLARDRDRREPRIPSRFKDFHLALNTESNEPSSYEEALESPDAKHWKML